MPLRLTEERYCYGCGRDTIHTNMVCRDCGVKALFSWEEQEGREYDATDDIDKYREYQNEIIASRNQEMYD